jgi:hypothetical protein
MNAENVLRIMQVAGLAGLVIGMFLLIARTALKTLPRPTKVPAASFFRTIDKIILFSFILSLVGLITYLFLEVRKYSRLQTDFDILSTQAAAIKDPKLKMRGGAIEVLECEITFDFTNWIYVPPEEQRLAQRSYEVTTTRRRVWRAYAETEKFYATYATDAPFEPNFVGVTHHITPVLNTDSLQSNKEQKKRWILEYDISNINQSPVRKGFDVITAITAWNALENPKEGKEGTLILFPTRQASLTVIFPVTKLPTNIECVYYSLTEGDSEVPFLNPKLTTSPNRSRVTWTIDKPNLGYQYLIRWKW